jgi:hypothetical protein
MNTQASVVSLLLATLSAGLAAQDMGLKMVAFPKGMTAFVDAAPKGSAVVLVLGLAETPSKLPDGQVLGIAQDLLAGFAIADGQTATRIEVNMPLNPGFTFYAQAVAVDLTLPVDGQKLRLSQVEAVEVAKHR